MRASLPMSPVDLGMQLPDLLRSLIKPRKPHVTASPASSLFARLSDGSIRTRRIGIVVADGVDVAAAKGAAPRYVGPNTSGTTHC